MNQIRSVKGTRDLLAPETAIWAAVDAKVRSVFQLFGYQEIRTPVLESTELFERGVGESTDIVGKQMYTFSDRKGRSLTLRPEGTAPVVRALVQHRLEAQGLPVRLFYIGPYFRYERPQKGRYRQFHQIGAELLGDAGPHTDFELISMLVQFLEELGFSDLEVQLNTVGDPVSREGYRAALLEFLEPRSAELSDESRKRLAVNPLRILDSKNPAERQLLAQAPRLDSYLSPSSREHFATVCKLLEGAGISYRIEPYLVRGLDYYTKTVFEIVSAGLGAQDAIVGGGRYDGLVAALGGSDIPGIGFAIGEDRLIELLPESFRQRTEAVPPVLVLPVEPIGAAKALELAAELRASGLAAIAEVGGASLKSALKRADKQKLRFVAILGEAEVARGSVALKDLASGEQEVVVTKDLVPTLRAVREKR